MSSVVPLAQLERRAILDALREADGDRTLAARLLGIGRTTIYRKLLEYQKEPESEEEEVLQPRPPKG